MLVLQVRVEERSSVELQEFHSEVNTVEVTVCHLEVSRPSSSSSHDHRIVLGLDLVDIVSDTNMSVVDEFDSLVGHKVETTLNDTLVELGVGDTVHEETSASVVTIVDGDLVTGLVELIGSRETSRTRSDDGDLLAGSVSGRSRCHPTYGE